MTWLRVLRAFYRYRARVLGLFNAPASPQTDRDQYYAQSAFIMTINHILIKQRRN